MLRNPWLCFIYCAVALLVFGEVKGGEGKAVARPLPRAVLFYSKEDPHWPKAEKAIDAVLRAYPDLKLAKVSFDDVHGYWQLLELERSLAIDPTGDMTLAIGTIALTSKGTRRDVEKYFAGVVRNLRYPDKGRGRLKVDPLPFARQLFGKEVVTEAVEPQGKADRSYRVLLGGKPVGWVVDAFRHITCPTCIDMQCLIAVARPGMRVLKVRPQRHIERYGVELDEEMSGIFLEQFEEWTPATPRVRVDAIVGATKTCRMYEVVVREVLKRIEQEEGKR